MDIDVDGQLLTIRYDNGVLSVTIPVSERARPCKIEVSGGGQANTFRVESGAAKAGSAAS